jgi:hypothetical protein
LLPKNTRDGGTPDFFNRIFGKSGLSGFGRKVAR